MVRAWVGAVRRAEAVGVVGTLHRTVPVVSQHAAEGACGGGGTAYYLRCAMPVQERASAGAVFWRGAFGGSGRGGMDSRFDGREGAELEGGFAVVAGSQVRVLSIATRCWLDGARVVADWRTGRATAAERKHGGVRAWHARQAATPSGGGMVQAAMRCVSSSSMNSQPRMTPNSRA